MGNLPPTRFTEVKPFHLTGVDFAGPFQIEESMRRNAPILLQLMWVFSFACELRSFFLN